MVTQLHSINQVILRWTIYLKRLWETERVRSMNELQHEGLRNKEWEPLLDPHVKIHEKSAHLSPVWWYEENQRSL